MRVHDSIHTNTLAGLHMSFPSFFEAQNKTPFTGLFLRPGMAILANGTCVEVICVISGSKFLRYGYIPSILPAGCEQQ